MGYWLSIILALLVVLIVGAIQYLSHHPYTVIGILIGLLILWVWKEGKKCLKL